MGIGDMGCKEIQQGNLMNILKKWIEIFTVQLWILIMEAIEPEQ